MYNKLVIFDLDGVLVDSREMHFLALNDALKALGQPTITMEEHLSTYDGLPTTAKLKLLTERKGVPVELYDKIWEAKQRYTIIRIYATQPNQKLIDIFKLLAGNGYKIAVAYNAIRATVKLYLLQLGIME